MAAAGAAADGLFRSVYEGCISESDACVERRPYHRNCGCALHNKSRNKQCAHAGGRSKTVSYPLRRAWSEGSLALMAANSNNSSAHSSPSSSSPGQNRHLHHHEHDRTVRRQHRNHSHHQLDVLCDEEEEEEEEEERVFFKV